SKLNAVSLSRGQIETVMTRDQTGSWVIQWGDEVFVPHSALAILRSSASSSASGELSLSPARTPAGRFVTSLKEDLSRDGLAATSWDEFLVLLDVKGSSCVALNEEERSVLLV